MWELSPNEQAHMFEQIYHAPIGRIFDALGQAKVFSTFDLKFGYHQLPLKEDTKSR